MSSTDRQTRLLVNEDWKTIYQSFRNADFQSYDFDNLRRTMINYLRQNYPEDFNDYIESSEYLALIDLIAFLGQNLSFRVDLNARENFLETAERKESVLRLARLISYNPRRNLSSNGLLKITAISTTENVVDSTGFNLAQATILWNDKSTPNWLERFTKILNSALPINNTIGRPLRTGIVSGINAEQYRFNSNNQTIPVYPFRATIEGISSRFELVSTIIEDNSLMEEPPLTGNSPSFVYRNDGQGPGSPNTGFFMHFRQGKLEIGNFNVTNPVPNQIINIDTTNINDTDIWLYSVDSDGSEGKNWSKIDSVNGNNIIYNSIFQNNRDVYTVTTRVDDRIGLVFSDGVFGNLPSGDFRIYYRTSENRNSLISPNNIRSIVINIPYTSKKGTAETLIITFSLTASVSNARPSETIDEIKTNAPAIYYTQNRLVTGEDYNIGPLGISQDVIKTKSVNRISSGISRYYDLKDPSGKYSNTSLFANDGIIYKERFDKKIKFSFDTQSDIEGVIFNQIEPILSNTDLKNFYYENFETIKVSDLNAVWNEVQNESNRSSGRFSNDSGNFYKLGSFASNFLRFVESEALVKFIPPSGNYFLPDGSLTTNFLTDGASLYKWTKIVSVYQNGTELNSDGSGPVIINDIIPSGSIITDIVPKFSRIILDDVKVQMIDRAFSYKDFALRYDVESRSWLLITAENINTDLEFSRGKEGDTTDQNLDSSWLLYFKTDGEVYTVTYRNLRYVFESKNEIRFFFDSADKIYDPKIGKVLKDKIEVLSVNKKPESLESFNQSFTWSISDAYRDADGYVDSRKIQIEFFDEDNDGVYDNIDLFKEIVQENVVTNIKNKYIFQESYVTTDGVSDYRYLDNTNNSIGIVNFEQELNQEPNRSEFYINEKIFYIAQLDVFKKFDRSANNTKLITTYKAFIGRPDLKFHYVHVADSNYRIDPASSNIIDTYILTRGYDTDVRRYLSGGSSSMPLPPSSDELFRNYGTKLLNFKSISDEIIYHPVKYKMLFGEKAKEDLQVTFKIVKNSELTINNNQLKANVVESINNFFALENWNFGDTFYFQELSAYVMNRLVPELVSFVIVPKRADQSFGSLFEIKSEPDEIFINTAQVSDIEIIDQITANNLQASGQVITSSNIPNTGIMSASSGSY